jgi:hypothetical protein
MRPRYRFGFVLSTGAGNRTRYLNLRKYAERDPSVECVWATKPGVADQGSLRARVETLRLAKPVLDDLGRLDAVVFHAFEPYAWTALRSLVARRPLLVWSQDDPPTRDPRYWQHYGLVDRASWRTALRYRIDRWCAGRVELFFPFSRWAGNVLIGDCGVAADKVHPVHVGVDLEQWPRVPARREGHRPRLLFVGGAFERKGGDLLVETFRRHFTGRAELHLVTPAAPEGLPPGSTCTATSSRTRGAWHGSTPRPTSSCYRLNSQHLTIITFQFHFFPYLFYSSPLFPYIYPTSIPLTTTPSPSRLILFSHSPYLLLLSSFTISHLFFFISSFTLTS